VHSESNHARGTIHPHPKGMGSSLPLDPNEIKDAKAELEDDVIDTVCGFAEVIKWEFIIHDD
jgi:hypothetical protein